MAYIQISDQLNAQKLPGSSLEFSIDSTFEVIFNQ